ncbi:MULTISPECIES: glucose 1-dehydrogenase [unclassified Lysobacter]|uniref:SDR family NAD(P)-dependent oxidoreductase n=1 Tax=unclassified Lysobacter TaxID=2635362 RepID=UPI001BEBE026|nr:MULTISPECIES: glucose 1-dehydrogenase [unclassified Lysobacter]MBT2748808.1 glucose 1-dehydrogenase [Lysobacter sp. ISL-42]MBT2754192.1 glucose 1-dehydrogenase [Lysobacter sp. ISL-50]MBT2777204.1 glucose 1-dehydrogenase [Lysobacter sp. ISL-54]MBT2780171.1 glucose 1-dehydrogenase [Lysobacter sp. ISL-52]
MSFPLAGKVALVTGGSRGIGAAIARRLGADGADVVLTYARAADQAQAVAAQIQAGGRRALALAADSADPQAVIAAVERTVAEFGRIDIVVNNAGVFAYGPFEDETAENYERVMAIHVRAPFVAAQAASRHLPRGGRIITIGSCLGERVGAPGMALYSLSKAAVVGLSKGLAQDLGKRGITVNTVQPGPIDTDMNPADGEAADHQRAGLPLGEFGKAEDIAAAVAYLAGPGAAFVTGTQLSVDGGFSA